MTEPTHEADTPDEERARALELIARALQGMRFGQVTVIVQDGVVVQLERDPDHFCSAKRRERGRDGAVDAARHGDDDPGITRRAAEFKIHPHWRSLCAVFTRISFLAPRPAPEPGD